MRNSVLLSFRPAPAWDPAARFAAPYLISTMSSGLQRLVEERLERAVEAEEHEPALARHRLDPVLARLAAPAGASGPNSMSMEPSAFAAGPV